MFIRSAVPWSFFISSDFDKAGRVKTVTDKRGILTENDYDSLGHLVETRRMNDQGVMVRLVSNEYDDAGKIAPVFKP